jgi:hypothetical protein
MQNLHRNPMLYYVLIPILVGIWPLLVWGVYLPATERACESDYHLLVQGQTHIIDILRIDPDITNQADPNRVAGEFAYNRAFDRAANLCGILPGNYTPNIGDIVTAGGKKRRDGRITLRDVSIVQAARFLSEMQSTWLTLTCEHTKLTRKKGMPEQWDVEFRFVYYY